MNDQALRDLLASLSLEEKAGQLAQIPLTVCTGSMSDPTGPLMELHLTPEQVPLCGSLICVEPGNAEVFARVIREMTDKHPHHIPPVLMRDMIHGTRTIFPIPLAMGCTFDEQLAERMARVTAAESAPTGVHATFAPMVDVVRDPRWGRVMESPGEAPALCAAMGAAMVRGFRGEGLDKPGTQATCVKHYAAYGLCEAGQEYSPIDVSRAELYNVYLPPFRAALDAGCDMVMSSFEAVDRIPCVCNRWLLRDVLRDWWGSDAMTISDYADVGQLLFHGLCDELKDAAALCLEAGMDMDMMSAAYNRFLPDLVREGRVSEALLDEACLRVLQLKNRLGLFEDPLRGASPEAQAEALARSEHREAALQAALRSCVLLKNEGVLPLKSGVRLALVGDHADERNLLGGWAGDGVPAETECLREALSRDERIVLTSPEEAEVILYAVGEPAAETGEASSKAHPCLTDAQMAEWRRLHALGKPVVAVVFAGRPLMMADALPLCEAMLYAWFPGSMGAEAIRRLIMGDASPSGHLSMTMPRCVGQIPIHHDRLTTARPQSEQRFTNRYLDVPSTPLFPFGFGLSYTDFALEDAALSAPVLRPDGEAAVEVTLRNTGACHGETVVQLYARMKQGSILRPERQLIGWKRVALDAGESLRVSLPVTQDMLALYDARRTLLPPRGDCLLAVGTDSTAPWSLTLRCDA